MTPEAAPEGGVVVASPPRGAGRRGNRGNHHLHSDSTYDWGVIVPWHRERPGTTAFYGPVRSDVLPALKAAYPDVTFLGHNHHYQITTTPTRDHRKMCTVFVVYETGADA